VTGEAAVRRDGARLRGVVALLLVIVDDQDARRSALAQRLRGQGHTVVTHASPDDLDPLLRADAAVVPTDAPAVVARLGPGVPLLRVDRELDRALAALATARGRDLLHLEVATVDLRQQRVIRDGRVERLTDKEANLLAWFASHPGEVIRREELLVEVWGYRAEMATRTVDNTVGRLRKKIERDAGQPTHIVTVRGEGYRYEPPGAVPVAVPRAPPPGLLGRDDELVLLDALVDRHRLVTVLGPAGIGKTSLARGLLAWRPGAVFVDLTTASSDSDAEELTMRALGGEAVAVAASLAARHRPLVVLDNVEQLVGAPLAGRLSTWLGANAELTLVVTSRVRLKHPHEHVLELGPLPLPVAVTLLTEAGRARRPDFASRRGSETHLAELAERLDRIPLALNLAAARARVLSVADLADRVRHDTAFLRDDRAGVVDRQKTLDGALAWSWRLLEPREAEVLAALAVFRGGFDLGSARALVGDDALDVVESLVDQSLVQSRRGSRSMRFDLFDSVRRFAADRLADAGRTEEVERRHAEWFAEEGLRRRLRSSTGLDPIAQLQTDRENTLVAVRRFLDRDPDLAARALVTLHPLWDVDVVPPRELRLVLALAERVSDPALRSELRFQEASTAIAQGRIEPAREAAAACFEAARAASDEPARLARAHLVMGHIHERAGDYAASRACFERAEAGADASTRVSVALSRGGLAYRVGDAAQASELLEQALLEARRHGTPWQELAARGMLGATYLRLGRYPQALTETETALAAQRAMGNDYRVGQLLSNVGAIRLQMGQPEVALGVLEEASELLAPHGRVASVGRLGTHLARTRRALGDFVGALEIARESIRLDEELDSTIDEAFARIEASHALRELGQLDAAVHEADRAVELAARLGIARQQAMARRARALVHLVRGELDGAESELVHALGFGGEREPVERAEMAADLALVHARRGEREAAAQWLEVARGSTMLTASARDRVREVEQAISGDGRS